LNPECLRREIVKAFETCSSDNAMHEINSRQSKGDFEKALGAEESPIE
jgi:hypothetical protein